MASYFHKIETNENGSKDQRQKVERERVKDNAFVGGSVKIDLIDDTALLNVVPFCKKKKVKIVLRDLELHTMIRKLWSDMYARLLPEMVTEYRGLVSLTNQKTSEFQSEGEWHRYILGNPLLTLLLSYLLLFCFVFACCWLNMLSKTLGLRKICHSSF